MEFYSLIVFEKNYDFYIHLSNNNLNLENQYKNSTKKLILELDFIYSLEVYHLVNLSLEILFWLILFIYMGARFTQAKKGFNQQHD